MPFLAFMRLEVKNDHAHVIMQDICNKFIEIKKLCRVYVLTVMLSVAKFTKTKKFVKRQNIFCTNGSYQLHINSEIHVD